MTRFITRTTSSVVLQRFTEVEDIPHGAPLPELNDQPLVPLPKAVASIKHLVPYIEDRCQFALEAVDLIERSDLTRDEAAAVHLYTQGWDDSTQSLYAKLNDMLREREQTRTQKLSPWLPFMKLLNTALGKLPISEAVYVWRGVPKDVTGAYPQGRVFRWWSYTSATTAANCSEVFCEHRQERTLFTITPNKRGIDVSKYSAFPSEEEVLFLPGTQFEVSGSLTENNVPMIFLKAL